MVNPALHITPESSSSRRRDRGTTYDVIGTKLLATDYESLIDDLIESWRKGEPRTLSFCNTFMVAKRRHDPAYRAITEICDTNLPDGMPLVWCMNRQGAGMVDRVYGPIFMERFLRRSPANLRHYLLGGDENCLRLLRESVMRLNPDLQLVGAHHGYFSRKDEDTVAAALRATDPEFVWVGMGTPKQDEWVRSHRDYFPRAILLPVGSSFEILAGMKRIPPMLFQRLGLTWMFRAAAEPSRLLPRYAKYNSLFLYYLFHDALITKAGSVAP